MKRLNDILRRSAALTVYAAAAFLVGITAGAIAYPFVEDRLPAFLGMAFGDVLSGSTAEMILKVFLRNTTASVIIMVLGLTVVLALLTLLLNGVVVGLIFRFAVDRGLGLTHLLLGVIPHGVFELPAIFLSAALGIHVGIEAATQKGRRIKATAEAIREASAAYIVFVLPLLAVAALMEILVSKNLIR